MGALVNPYIAGNPVGGSGAFVGRDDVLQAVLRIVRDPQHRGVVLYGQRRIGKTSILHHLERWLPDNGGPRTIYFDLQDKAGQPVGKIMVELAAAIADALDLPEPEPGPEPAAWFRDRWLPGVFEKLAGESLAILFDEFDVLADAESQRTAAAAFFGYLRELLEKSAPRLRVVIVIGRNVEDLSYLAGPLFKTLPSKHISLLQQAEAAAVARLSEKNGSLRWSDEAVAAVWSLTHGHPYLLQHLCWQIWARAHESGAAARPVTAADVKDAVAPTLDASRNALEWLWGGLPPAARVVTAALARAGHGAITEDTLHRTLNESGVRVVIRELRDAPRLLQEWDVLEPAEGGHRFRVELFRQWVARFKPLERVQEELDKIDPLADTLYKAGAGFYKAGQIESALEQLQKAIDLNPNHRLANELVAELLISKGAWREARAVLEKLAENFPAMARPRLVQVLLAQAAGAGEAEATEIYDRVLSIDPKNGAALEGKRKTSKLRGDRARAAGQLDAALEAYREAGLSELAGELAGEIRERDVRDLLERVRELETAGQFGAALDVISQARDRLTGSEQTTATIARLQMKKTLAEDYERAAAMLSRGDRQAAIPLLRGVIALDPTYRDAARLLHEALGGKSIDDLTRALQNERTAREQAEERERAERSRLEAQLAAESAEKDKLAADVESLQHAQGDLWTTLKEAQKELADAKEAREQLGGELEAGKQKRRNLLGWIITESVILGGVFVWASVQAFYQPSSAVVTQPAPTGEPAASGSEPPAATAPTAIELTKLSPEDVQKLLARIEEARNTTCPDGMVKIPGARFLKGSSNRADANPVSSVEVSTYCLDATEVTSEAYLDCVMSGPCSSRRSGPGCNISTKEATPANCVTWAQSNTYCAYRGKRLPTEDEWEYAARGQQRGTVYPWGGAELSFWCWNGPDNDAGASKRARVCPVKSYPADSIDGIYDLGGNVAEWTGTWICPDGECKRSGYILRGGSWYSETVDEARAARRYAMDENFHSNTIGFRCAKTPEPTSP